MRDTIVGVMRDQAGELVRDVARDIVRQEFVRQEAQTGSILGEFRGELEAIRRIEAEVASLRSRVRGPASGIGEAFPDEPRPEETAPSSSVDARLGCEEDDDDDRAAAPAPEPAGAQRIGGPASPRPPPRGRTGRTTGPEGAADCFTARGP